MVEQVFMGSIGALDTFRCTGSGYGEFWGDCGGVFQEKKKLKDQM